MELSRFNKPLPLAWGDADKIRDDKVVRQIVSDYFMETDETIVCEAPKGKIPLINPQKSEKMDDSILDEVDSLITG